MESSDTIDKDEDNGECVDEIAEGHVNRDNSSSMLTKNQLKRQRRLAYWEEKKKIKKRKRKEHKSEVNKLLDTSPKPNIGDNNVVKKELSTEEKLALKVERERKYQQSCDNSFSVIIDCSYESIHAERPLKSLCQQVMFCYALNKAHSKPISMYVTGVGQKSTDQLTKVNYKSWKGVTVTNEDFIALPQFTLANISSTSKQRTLVYLSSDADEVLEDLDPTCAYVIGGIVDRNLHKGIAQRKAVGLGMRTARLPIREHILLSGTHILTVNHVFEILMRFSVSNSWPDALEVVLPKRKVTEPVTLEPAQADVKDESQAIDTSEV